MSDSYVLPPNLATQLTTFAFFLLALFALLALTLATVGPGTCSNASEPASGVILITLDTTRADRLSLYGYRRPTTPTLEALAPVLAIRQGEREFEASPEASGFSFAPCSWRVPLRSCCCFATRS